MIEHRRLHISGLVILVGSIAATIYLAGSTITNDESARLLQEKTLEEEPPVVHWQESLIDSQFSDDPHAGRDHLQMILDGKLGLASVRYSPGSFGEDTAYGSKIHVEFCDYDLSLHQQSPADYPTIPDITDLSDHCGEHRYAMPLLSVVDAVRAHDKTNTSNIRALPVSGILFHEGRSGAGLISNALHSLKSTRVISEHPAILDVLRACDMIENRHGSTDCSVDKQQKLIQDIVYLLSRTKVTEDDEQPLLFLKMHSTASAYLKELRASFPDAKWAFVYRESDAALAKVMEHKHHPCVKSRRNPPSSMASMAQSLKVDLNQLTKHEVCAMHLATFLQVAKDEHERTGTGLLVSYDEDILGTSYNVIMDKILPYLGVEDTTLDSETRNDVSSIFSLKSNASGEEGDSRKWDATTEIIDITAEVRDASQKFMSNAMNAIVRSRRARV